MPSNAQVPSFPRNRLCQKAGFEVRKANPSFPRKRESRVLEGCYSGISPLHPAWIPAFAGMTIAGAVASLGWGFDTTCFAGMTEMGRLRSALRDRIFMKWSLQENRTCVR